MIEKANLMHQGYVLAVRIQISVVLLCFHSAQHKGILEISRTKRDWFEKRAREGAHWEEQGDRLYFHAHQRVLP